jgi:hypothetical protein
MLVMLIANLRRYFLGSSTQINSDWLSPSGAPGGATERPNEKTLLTKHFDKTLILSGLLISL